MASSAPEYSRTIGRIESTIRKACARDRLGFKREINRLKQDARKGDASPALQQRLVQLMRRVNASAAKRRERIAARPAISEFADLPITAKKEEIIAAIRAHAVVIISGETGSGKTTQIPKFCLAAGRGIDGLIGCTQPRRIAAITVAERIAEELGEPAGRSVGYKIRFTDKTGPNAYIKIMTDGMLLAETQGDPDLHTYDTLIIDEAHERSLNIDFLLGILKTLLHKRTDLKLIITSATIDTEKFSRAFDNAPIIEVSGRMYPVEIRYAPGATDDELSHMEKAAFAVDRLIAESRFGDILVFMPTEGDIRETIELIEGRNYRNVTVLPLFARLSAADQHRVFATPVGRKIIVATNIAETSLTIPGIKYVVDTGLARISQYNPRSRTTALPVTSISQSSADQRMGRCGRVANGICVRLFPEEDYLERPRFTRPEILRANLAEVILRMIALNLGNISEFPFLDMPPGPSIQDGFNLLFELGAISQAGPSKGKKQAASPFILTEKGQVMAAMPIDPRLSCMLIEAVSQGCLPEVCIIAAALSIQDPRERPAEKAAEADRAHARFKDPSSDFVTLLNIWNAYQAAWNQNKKMRQIMKFCSSCFLSFKRMREWRDIHGQLQAILAESNLPARLASAEKPASADKAGNREYSETYERIHKAILSGFLSNIAAKKEGNIYQAAKDRQAMLFPGSGLFNQSRQWIVAAEMVETSRLFARMAAHIDPAWLEPIGKDRCKHTYFDPHWERSRGNVIASEQVSLFGLIIEPARNILYGRIRPEEASDIFIQSALVAGDVRRPLPFMRHNQALIDTVQTIEHKVRRRDLLISEADLFHFYKSRISGVYDMRTLERRIREKGDDFLHMKEEDLLRYAPDREELARYPDKLQLQNTAFPFDYRFEPGSQTDGVTIRIPAAAAGAVSKDTLEWLVPGLLKEKLSALIKSLPKIYRRQLVPVSETIDIIAQEMEKKKEGLLSSLGEFIHQRFGVDIPVTAWAEDLLPDHLKMRIAITAPDGKEIAAGRNPSLLNHHFLAEKPLEGFEDIKKEWEKTGITQWDFDDLPERIALTGKKGGRWVAYPALVPDESGGRQVHLRLFLNQTEAAKIHRSGVYLLTTLHLSNDLKLLKKMIALPKAWIPKAARFGGEKKIQAQLIESITLELFSRDIRTREAFETHAAAASARIVAIAQERLDVFLPVLDAVCDTRERLFAIESTRHLAPIATEIRTELAHLAPENLLLLYTNERLRHLPRYIRALGIRAIRAVENPERDRLRMNQVQPYRSRLTQMLESLTPGTSEKKRAAVEEYFWMLEEFKVSVFAQELKTVIPISPKRLDKKAGEIERMM
ncbi:MAG: ATP-dependent RNA helicase HrpA [Desulfobacterales bacterium]|jgi:ATP-dependent helicase HrpA|nr:ATP-dependent RNA helicase HrpA [Desulfobacterales bacterium]